MIDAQVIWSCGAFTSAIARNKVPPPHAESISNPITPDVAQTMIGIYERMTDLNLLKRLAKGKTQNANECLYLSYGRDVQERFYLGS